MAGRKFTVKYDSVRGYRRLDPVPDSDALDSFYTTEYALDDQTCAPDVKRLREETAEGVAERTWRFGTIYRDVLHYVTNLGVGPGLAIDVGSGTGEFLRYLNELEGWNAVGIERDESSIAVAQRAGVSVVGASIDDLAASENGTVDLVTLFNVLEHLPDPLGTLGQVYRLLRPGGLVVVQVPNDYSNLQDVTRTFLDVEPWWIAIPDHINYFDYQTLGDVLRRTGFECRHQFGTFPMEFFLLSGVDYLTDPTAGLEAHRARCTFELSLSDEQRRAFNESLARGEMGRNAVIVAQRPLKI